MFPGTPIEMKNKGEFDGVLEIPTILSPMGEFSKDLQNLPVRQTLDKINDVFAELERQIPVVMPQIAKTFDNVNKAVLVNLSKAADGINNAANSFENLADYLERHPEALLRGKEKVK